jgi:hypothetical protein
MNKYIISVFVGLALGILATILIVMPSLTFQDYAERALNQSGLVLVSGTVSDSFGNHLGGANTLYFDSVNQSIGMSAPLTNNYYSVLLVAGLSYYVFLNYNPPIANCSNVPLGDTIGEFHVPLGITTFTKNFALF